MSDFVWLQAGLIIPVAAIEAMWNIHRAGHRLSIDGADLLVEPRGHVDPHDLEQLRRWKQHALLLLRYTADDRHVRDESAPMPDVGLILLRSDL